MGQKGDSRGSTVCAYSRSIGLSSSDQVSVASLPWRDARVDNEVVTLARIWVLVKTSSKTPRGKALIYRPDKVFLLAWLFDGMTGTAKKKKHGPPHRRSKLQPAAKGFVPYCPDK